ncbi:MAG TPA: extracellular solute-binding protein [Chloroflexota bacterium]
MRVALLGTGVGLAAGVLSACSAPAPAAPTSAPQAAPTSGAPAATSKAETKGSAAAPTAAPGVSGTAATAADVAKAKQEGAVMLYTSLDTKIVDSIIQPFQERYGIKVEYFRAGSAQVSGKVLAEADAGKVLADVVDASDVGAFLAMKERGLLKPYESPAAKSVPKELRDPDGTWVADRLTQAIIQWNTSAVGGSPPKSWKDLVDGKYSGKLAFFSSSAGDGAPRLYNLAQVFGWDLLQGLAANKPLRVDTPQLLTQVLEKGERAVAFAQNDNIAWRSKLEGKPTDYIFPSEGVPTELGAVGLPKDAPHPNAAMLFYDWWMGDEGQRLLVEGGKYSSRTDLAPPEGSVPLSQIKTLVLDYAEYQSQRKEILKRMAEIFGGEWGG